MTTSNNIKKTITKKSNGMKAQKVGRPINCFMAFRLEKHQEISAQSPGLNHRDISKIIAKWWKKASEAEKAPYRAIASKAKAAHAKLYPDYKYKPVKKSERQVRPYRHREDAATRKRKAQAKEELMKQWMTSPASSFCDSPSTPTEQNFSTPSRCLFMDSNDNTSYFCGSTLPQQEDQHAMTTDSSFFLNPSDKISLSFIQSEESFLATDPALFLDTSDDDSSFCDSPSTQVDTIFSSIEPSFSLDNDSCDLSFSQIQCPIPSFRSPESPCLSSTSHELKSQPPSPLIINNYFILNFSNTEAALPKYINPQMLSLYPGL